MNWLAENKVAGVCFTLDDVHPAKSTDRHEAGGDCGRGALGHLEWLLDRHPALKASVLVTPDWREISPWPSRRLLATIPVVRDWFYLAPVLPKGTMRLDRHPEFVAYLNGLPRTECVPHGLHHVHRGLNIPVEFQNQTREEFRQIIREVLGIFRQAGLKYAPGFAPPAWNAPDTLLAAMVDEGLKFIPSTRDLVTPISRDAVTNMSGMKNVSLIRPQLIFRGKLVQIPTNFQATSPIDRAVAVIECSGLLSIKAHIVDGFLDSFRELYRNYLDLVFSEIEDRYGESIEWLSLGEIADRMLPQP